jgi:DNA-binding transcriptional MerR regulator
VGSTTKAAGLRIGEAAEQVGVSCRTLRYYEELGLVAPSQHSAGGARRYSEDDVVRLQRIRELQELLGFDLGEIGEILRGEDQLADIRHHYRQASASRRLAMLEDATAINERLRSLVQAKQARLTDMLDQLDAKAARYQQLREELVTELAEASDGDTANTGTSKGDTSDGGPPNGVASGQGTSDRVAPGQVLTAR